nr:kinesin-like protein KIN-7L [Setaria viridis]
MQHQPTDARCQKLEKDCISDPQQLDESNARCEALEKECDLLRDKNSSLQQELSESMREADRLVAEKQVELEDSKARCALLERELSKSRQDAERLATEKQELAGELGVERQKMEELKQDIRVISRAFSQREGQLTSLYTKSKAILENCKASHVATLP